MAVTTNSGWISTLADTGISTDLSSLAGFGTLTFSAAQQILADVAAKGPLTQAEMSSLQTIAAHLNNGLATDSYTASVFTQLVNGSPLNAVWTGGVAEGAVWTGGQENATVLGNLALGSTQTQMTELIGKWFLGTDHPSAPWSMSGDTSLRYASYFAQTTPLYGTTGAPAASDVNQGSIGDCVLCSALIDYVVQHPTQAATMVKSEGNGVYGVRFYVGGNESWVTVDNSLPQTSDGRLIFDGSGVIGQSVLWASLVEKAYAQFVANGLEGLPAINNYGNITDVPIQVLLAISGASTITSLAPTLANPDFYKQTLINALANHDDVEVFSPLGAPDLRDANGKITLATDHAQALVGYDSKTGLFIVQNPWGNQNSSTYDATWEMSLSQVASVGGTIQIDNSGQVGPSATPSNIVMTVANQQVVSGQMLNLASLFHASSISGGAITEYAVAATSGTVNLNGAINLATAAQTAQGEVVVSTADLAKLTLSGVSASGDLSVSAYDGGTWSPAVQVALTLSGTTAGIVPLPMSLAPGQTVPLSQLFHVIGTLGASNDTWYDVIVPIGAGAINLNGAANVWGGGNPPTGSYQLTAASLPQVTYTAPSTGGPVTLQLQLYTETSWSGWENEVITVNQPMTASTAAQHILNGQFESVSAVSDTAANIVANLGALQAGRAAGAITGITLIDTGTPTLNLTSAQFSADTAALGAITSAYNLALTGGTDGQATTIMLPGNAAQWAVTPAGDGQGLTLTEAGNSTTYAMKGVTALKFADYTDIIASQTPAVAGAVSSFQVASLYSAVFARTPDAAGLAYYQGVAAANPSTTITSFAEWFLSSPEYTGNPTHAYAQSAAGDAQFITDTYNNLLHRAPGSGDVTFYQNKVIDPIIGSATPGTSAYAAAELQAHAQVLAFFSLSPEFRADVQITAQHPADAQHWLILI